MRLLIRTENGEPPSLTLNGQELDRAKLTVTVTQEGVTAEVHDLQVEAEFGNVRHYKVCANCLGELSPTAGASPDMLRTLADAVILELMHAEVRFRRRDHGGLIHGHFYDAVKAAFDKARQRIPLSLAIRDLPSLKAIGPERADDAGRLAADIRRLLEQG
jgi:hypothetical protein